MVTPIPNRACIRFPDSPLLVTRVYAMERLVYQTNLKIDGRDRFPGSCLTPRRQLDRVHY
jgi:hypothetical protein